LRLAARVTRVRGVRTARLSDKRGYMDVADRAYVEEETGIDDAVKEVLALDEAGVADLVAVYEGIERRYFAAVAAEAHSLPPVAYTTHT
jgi:hypothetical protein